MTTNASTVSNVRRRGGRALRLGLAVALLGKTALLVASYGGGVSALLAPTALVIAAETHAAGGAAHGRASEDAAAATKAAGAAADGGGARGAAGSRQLASLERAAVADGGKPPNARALVEAITRRQTELDVREQELAAREERLHLFEQDVTAKVASLEEIEKRLQGRAKAASAAVDAAAESLAKVYGAMKAADAAPILERLDEATVLSIFGRMKEKQIGEILPLMTKDKAIALTHALATNAR
jgi:flagellar motility protein MotE (MotC chaperone)